MAGCGLDGPQSTLDPRGPVAKLQGDVFFIALMVCLGIFLATSGLLAYAVWRFRARVGDADKPIEQTHGNAKTELALIGIVLLLLLVIAIPNLQALFTTGTMPDPGRQDVLRVDVTGRQWWWVFEYPGLGVVTANELHIPVGRPVLVRLRTDDVIHSFWVPKLAGKMDLMPNQNNQMWFAADAAGEYFGQCAEFCGASHAHMRFRVIAQSQPDFEAWVAGQVQPAVAPTAPLALQGSKLFIEKGCGACHAIVGTPAQGVAAPNLTHFGSRRTMAAGMMENSPENIARWLANPPAVKPNSSMPNLGLNAADITALSAYLQGLK
jgi:cytochrome c oxidase subunit 2